MASPPPRADSRPGGRDRPCWSCRSARPSSTGRTCRWGPTPTIAVALARGWPRGGPYVVAPALPYGSSGEHAGFAGTLSIGQAALRAACWSSSCRSARRPSRACCSCARTAGTPSRSPRRCGRLRAEGRDVRAGRPAGGGDAHAGRTETVAAARPAPGPGRPERAEPGNTAPLAELLPRLRAGGVRAVSPNGVLGDPAGASAAEGRALLAAADRGPASRSPTRRRRARRARARLAGGARGEPPRVAVAPARGSRGAPAARPTAARPGGSRWSPAPPAGSARRPSRALARDGWSVVAVDRVRRRPAAAVRARHRGASWTRSRVERVRAVAADVRDADALARRSSTTPRRAGAASTRRSPPPGVIAGGAPPWELARRAGAGRARRRPRRRADRGPRRRPRAAAPARSRATAGSSRSPRAAATRGLPMLAAYCAAKAGVAGLDPRAGRRAAAAPA